MTEQEQKQIEQDALEAFPVRMGPTANYLGREDYNEGKRDGYEVGATALRSKYPCSPERAQEAIDTMHEMAVALSQFEKQEGYWIASDLQTLKTRYNNLVEKLKND